MSAPSPAGAQRFFDRAEYACGAWSRTAPEARLELLAACRRALVDRALREHRAPTTPEAHLRLEAAGTQLLPLAACLRTDRLPLTRGGVPGVVVLLAHERDGARAPLGVALEALCRGSAAVVLYSPRVPELAMELTDLLRDAGLPRWLLQTSSDDGCAPLRAAAQPSSTTLYATQARHAEARAHGLECTLLEHRRGTAYVDQGADCAEAAAQLAQALCVDGAEHRLSVGLVFAHEELHEALGEALLLAFAQDPLRASRSFAGPLEAGLFPSAALEECEVLCGEPTALLHDASTGPVVLTGARAASASLLRARGVPVLGLLPVRSAEAAARMATELGVTPAGCVFAQERSRALELAERWPSRVVGVGATLLGAGPEELAAEFGRFQPGGVRYVVEGTQRWLAPWPYTRGDRWSIGWSSWWHLRRRAFSSANGDLL